MIKITIQYDLVINFEPEEIKEIGDYISGIYVLMDEEDQPLYVGMTKDFKMRLRAHRLEKSPLRRFSHHIQKAALIYESDSLTRKVMEEYLINKLAAPLNISSVHPKKLEPKPLDAQPYYFGRCKGKTVTGTGCRGIAHSNGLCRWHRGNGMTISKIAKQGAAEAVEVAKNESVWNVP